MINKKIISSISYLTIIGWIVAYVFYNNGGKSILAKYHLKQSFGLAIFGLLIAIASMVLTSIIPSTLYLFSLLSLVVFAFFILGIINAINEKKAPLPLIGHLFANKFHFIK